MITRVRFLREATRAAFVVDVDHLAPPAAQVGAQTQAEQPLEARTRLAPCPKELLPSAPGEAGSEAPRPLARRRSSPRRRRRQPRRHGSSRRPRRAPPPPPEAAARSSSPDCDAATTPASASDARHGRPRSTSVGAHQGGDQAGTTDDTPSRDASWSCPIIAASRPHGDVASEAVGQLGLAPVARLTGWHELDRWGSLLMSRPGSFMGSVEADSPASCTGPTFSSAAMRWSRLERTGFPGRELPRGRAPSCRDAPRLGARRPASHELETGRLSSPAPGRRPPRSASPQPTRLRDNTTTPSRARPTGKPGHVRAVASAGGVN